MARQARGQHGDGDDEPPASPGDGGEALQHLPVGQHLRPADVERAAHVGRQVRGADEIVQHVVDGDRLDPVVQPLRRDHGRQPGGEIAQHVERRGAVTDHDGCLEHRRGDARAEQDAADLDPRLEMRRQRPVRVQATEVDDPPHARLSCRGGERRGEAAVPPGEVDAAVHGVEEEVGHLYAVHRPPHVAVGRGVPLDDVDGVAPRRRAEGRPAPGEHPDPPPRRQQSRHQQPSDVAGRPGDEGGALRAVDRAAGAVGCGGVRVGRRLPGGCLGRRLVRLGRRLGRSGHRGYLTSWRTGGRSRSMPQDHVTWVIIGPSTPPVTRRCRAVSSPTTAAANTSSGTPLPRVVSV